MRPLLLLAFSVPLGWAGIVEDVRGAISHHDFSQAGRAIEGYRAANGVTPEVLEALSWMARGSLAEKNYADAEKYARQTHDLCVAQLRKGPLDREAHLPIALGAAIEVQGNVLAAQGQRADGIAYLEDQLKLYYSTSIRTRLQKDIHLLGLEGRPAPALEQITLPKGRPALLFFWAHWCPDCKAEAPVLARLKAEFEPRGLVLIAPTQKYGYVAEGKDAPPAVELPYIEKIRRQYYAQVITSPAPVSEENFRRYGASTTPTLVLVDGAGIVRMYHPGQMTYEELRPRIAALFKSGT